MSKFKLFISCNDTAIICDKAQYNEASYFEKIKHKIHLFYCKLCRKYTKNNNKLTEHIKTSKVDCLDNDCKEKIKNTIDQALSEQK